MFNFEHTNGGGKRIIEKRRGQGRKEEKGMGEGVLGKRENQLERT